MDKKPIKAKRRVTKQAKVLFTIISVLVLAVIVIFFWPKHDSATVGQIQCPQGRCEEDKLNEEHAKRLAYLKECKETNDEFIGVITVGTLIEEEVAQSQDNEKYLNLSFDKKEDTQGSVFMDYRNQLSDQNLIFYGHFVYKDESAKFSPLHQLKEKENYSKNRFITIDLIDEVRIYEIAYVYYYEMDNPNLEYYHPDYGNELEGYLKSIEEKAFYKTKVKITSEDKFVTLQTCVRDRDDLRLIVVAKQVNK